MNEIPPNIITGAEQIMPLVEQLATTVEQLLVAAVSPREKLGSGKLHYCIDL